ncbi:hypothetical protein DFH28DRAFT_950343 [Melampsora americana]|nr:hypothetical protein DFH28DRAFT_950343 [Melampsora americana]
MLEENDGDDDTIARAAYKKRNSKPPMKDSHHRSDAGGDGHMNFEGLPDEPFTPRLQSVHQQEPSTSSHQPTTTFDHHSLNLQNLSLLSPKDFNLNLQSDFSNLSKKSNSKSNASVNKTPASFKKIINRNRIKFNKPMMKRISSIDLNPTNLNVDSHHSNPHHHNPVVELDFNSLPMRAQLVCLNELMKLHSNSGSDLEEEEEGKEETALIFTSLPPPDLGSSNSYENSSKYLNEIESFLDGLPPVLAIYAKQLTVTASL